MSSVAALAPQRGATIPPLPPLRKATAEELIEFAIARFHALDVAGAQFRARDRIGVVNGLTAAIGQLAKLRGEGPAITEARILRHPALKRIQETILEALTPWPDAMRAVGEALIRLGQESGDHP